MTSTINRTSDHSITGSSDHPILHCTPPATQLYLAHTHPACCIARRVVFSSSGDLTRADLGPHKPGIFRTAQYAAESLFSVLFPSDCRICQSPLTTISTLPVCETCLGKVEPIDGLLCSVCGERLLAERFSAETKPVCGICRRVPPNFTRAVAFGAYEGALRDLIHVFKYQHVKSAAPLLARYIHRAIAAQVLREPLLVVPVPLWENKRKVRGFNQAEEIARSFVRSGRAAASIQLDATSLVRRRETMSQTGLTRHQRRANLRGAFAVVRRERIRERTILVVDDVMTTGATAGECARVLLRAGAKEVYVATVARATREAVPKVTFSAAASAGGTQGHA
ncbi:MAG TPA: ComF family protein [Terriglobales bacterium]|nr:ComF family protein [Terriglobales bacterium]